ncbi:YraN family protein [soil metagenome]
MSAHIELGRAGEDAAAAFYRRRGYRIVDRNYGCCSGEIDLVLSRGRLLVFCEVKTRTSPLWGAPAEAVGPLKQNRIRRSAGTWLAEHRGSRRELRFDVVSVSVAEGGLEVTHLPGAF